MIVDTHAHLTYPKLRDQVPALLERARAAGVAEVISVGTDPDDSRAAVALARSTPGVWAAVGVHPNDTADLTESALDDLADVARDPTVVAWGEIGLDYYRDRTPAENQKRWLRAQLDRARTLDLPVILHDREAHEDTLAVLREDVGSGLRGVFHCFSGDRTFAREVIARGFFVSFTGPITYPKNEELRRVAAEVPLEKILVETDCPFLSPQPFRGKPNEPAHVVHVVDEIARVRGLSREDVARVTTRASAELFGVAGAEGARIAYPIRQSLYLNLTDRCTNRCSFCAKNRSRVIKGHDLSLEVEPTVDEVLAAVDEQGGAAAWDEVVFCGLGEPLLRLDEVVSLSRTLRRRGAHRIRLNTDGLASLVHGRDVTAELAGVVDAVSVSLNAPDAATYERLCRPTVRGAYEALLAFLSAARDRIPEVTATVVAVPGLDVEACRDVARDKGVAFRVREYNEVG